MLPITVTDVGPGYVVGTERIVTQQPGTFSFGTAARQDSAADVAGRAAAAGCPRAASGGATVELFDETAAFVRQWTVRDALSFSIQLAAGQMAVASRIVPDCTEVSNESSERREAMDAEAEASIGIDEVEDGNAAALKSDDDERQPHVWSMCGLVRSGGPRSHAT